MIRLFVTAGMLFFVISSVFADVKPSNMFGDGMVLQSGQLVPVWGDAEASEEITVEFAGQTKTTKADENGKWIVKLDKLKPSKEGRRFIIKGKNEIAFNDVLVGTVWVCAGQSNMDLGYKACPELRKLAPLAEKKAIRTFEVTKNVSFKEEDNCLGKWTKRFPESAVALAFSYYLQEKLDVPVGVIVASWGSTSIEGWLPLSAADELPSFKKAMDHFNSRKKEYISTLIEKARKSDVPIPKCWTPKEDRWLRTSPNIIYNAMMHPIAPYAMSGILWYQGEQNSSRPEEYKKSLHVLLKCLHKLWGRDDFQFDVVMLPRFGNKFEMESADNSKNAQYPQTQSWAWFREAQMSILDQPNTAVVNIIDTGDLKNIHPRDKLAVGKRIADFVFYNERHKKVQTLGPRYKSYKVIGNKVIITFEDAAGLKTNDGKEPSQFWVSGSDKKWVKAHAAIKGNTVELTAEGVKEPVAVRYAFAAFPLVNLVNNNGFPAYPFRTDTWKRN